MHIIYQGCGLRRGRRAEAQLWPGLESGFLPIPPGALRQALHLSVGPTLRQQAWLLIPHVSQPLAAVAWGWVAGHHLLGASGLGGPIWPTALSRKGDIAQSSSGWGAPLPTLCCSGVSLEFGGGRKLRLSPLLGSCPLSYLSPPILWVKAQLVP